MAFNSVTLLNNLVTMVTALPGIQSVSVGIPDAMIAQLSAYISLADADFDDSAPNLLVREQRLMVTLAYQVGAVDQAELGLAAVVDAFWPAFYGNAAIRAACTNTRAWPNQPADLQYMQFAGSEYRVYPIIVACVQMTAY